MGFAGALGGGDGATAGSEEEATSDGAEGEAYERVSERLYRAVNRAIAAAANESFRRN